MWKKRAWVMFALAWGIALFGLLVRAKFPDCGMASVKNTEMLDEQKVYFKSVDGKSEAQYYREHEEEYIAQNESCACVFVAKPTGNIRPGSVNSMQEVTVQKIIKGNPALKDETIWVDNAVPGFVLEENGVYMDAATNFMQTGDEYLIFCNAYGSIILKNVPECAKYYAADCFFGYLNLTKKYSTDGLVEMDKKYAIKELKEAEFFASDPEVLEARQEIKKKILQLYEDII